MSNTGASLKPEAVREIDYTLITSAFAAFGSPLTGWARYILMDNNTDVDIYLSKDGVKKQWRVRSGTSKVYDLKTNDIFLSPGDQLYISYKGGVAPTRGDVFVEVGCS
jgi:hypothetical protein